jgi:hypothetical protein
VGDFIGTTISGMMGPGSISHNNRKFFAANVDRSRTEQNVTYCNDDLKQVYHELFDEAMAAYNTKKKKTRDKITDYYEHIRQGKQEKLFHEAIFQIGNLEDCGCGSPGGERAAAALKEFAESFQERNPHLRVFNMVLHMDEATPHLHVDYIPVATEQSRGLSTRVSMKQALKQQGFEGQGRKQTEWNAWMEREKAALIEIAQAHEFEIISLGGGRPHMDLPQYREAAQRLEAVQEQVAAAGYDIAELEKQKKDLQGTVRRLQAAEKVRVDLDAIQPEKTLTGAVKGVTVEQVKELKAAAIRGAAAEQKVKELKVENQQLHSRIPSVQEKLKEAEERQRLERENRKLKNYTAVLEDTLDNERSFIDKLVEGLIDALDFLEKHLPEPLHPLLEKLQKLVNAPEVVMRGMDQPEPKQEPERSHTWGDMTM